MLQYLAAGVPVISTKLLGLQGALLDNPNVIWVDSVDDMLQVSDLSYQPKARAYLLPDDFRPAVAVARFRKFLVK